MTLRDLISHNIKTIREQQGITQKVLATKAQVTIRYLSSIENSSENLSTDLLERFAKALGVPPARLVSAVNNNLTDKVTAQELLQEIVRIASLTQAILNTQPVQEKQSTRVHTKKI